MGQPPTGRLSSASSWLVRVTLYCLSLIVCFVAGFKKRLSSIDPGSVAADKHVTVEVTPAKPNTSSSSRESMQLCEAPASSSAAVDCRRPEPDCGDSAVIGDVAIDAYPCSTWTDSGPSLSLHTQWRRRGRGAGFDGDFGRLRAVLVLPPLGLGSLSRHCEVQQHWQEPDDGPVPAAAAATGCFRRLAGAEPGSRAATHAAASAERLRTPVAAERRRRRGGSARTNRTRPMAMAAAEYAVVPEVVRLHDAVALRSPSGALSELFLGKMVAANLIGVEPSPTWRLSTNKELALHLCALSGVAASLAVSPLVSSAAGKAAPLAASSSWLCTSAFVNTTSPAVRHWPRSVVAREDDLLPTTLVTCGQARLLLLQQGRSACLILRMPTGLQLVRNSEFSADDGSRGNDEEGCCCSDEALQELVHCTGMCQCPTVMWSYVVSTENSPEAIEVLLGHHHRALTLPPRDTYSCREVSTAAAAAGLQSSSSLGGSDGQHRGRPWKKPTRSLPDTSIKGRPVVDRKQGGSRQAPSAGLGCGNPSLPERASAPAVVLRAPAAARPPGSQFELRCDTGKLAVSPVHAATEVSNCRCWVQTDNDDTKAGCGGAASTGARSEPLFCSMPAVAERTAADVAADVVATAMPPMEHHLSGCCSHAHSQQQPPLAGTDAKEPSWSTAAAAAAAPPCCVRDAAASITELCSSKQPAGAGTALTDRTMSFTVDASFGCTVATTTAPPVKAAAAAAAAEPDLVCERLPADDVDSADTDGCCKRLPSEAALPEPDVVPSRTLCGFQGEPPDVVPCGAKTQPSTSSQCEPLCGDDVDDARDWAGQGRSRGAGTGRCPCGGEQSGAAADGHRTCTTCSSDLDSGEVFVAGTAVLTAVTPSAAVPPAAAANGQQQLVECAAAATAATTAATASTTSKRLASEERELRRRASARECVAQGRDIIGTAAAAAATPVHGDSCRSPASPSSSAASDDALPLNDPLPQPTDGRGHHRPLIRQTGTTGMRYGDSSTFPPMSTAMSGRRSLRKIFAASSIMSALSRLRRASLAQPGSTKQDAATGACADSMAAAGFDATRSDGSARQDSAAAAAGSASADASCAAAASPPLPPASASGKFAAMLKSRSFSDLRGRSRKTGLSSPTAVDPLLLSAAGAVAGGDVSATLSPRRQSEVLLERRRGKCRSLIVEGPTQASRIAAAAAAGSAAATSTSNSTPGGQGRTTAEADTTSGATAAAAAPAAARRLPVNSHLLRSNRHSMPLLPQSLSLHDLRAGDGSGSGGASSSGGRQSVEQARRERSRRLAALTVDELLLTERDYVAALRYVVDEYALPETSRVRSGSGSSSGRSAGSCSSREHCDESKGLPLPQQPTAAVPADDDNADVVFGNVEEICKFHCRHFLPDLEACVADPFSVGACFLKYREEFRMYSAYIRNKPKSDALMLSFGMSLFKHKQTQLADPLDLSSYLLKPIQRLGKYALILRRLLKECSIGGTDNDESSSNSSSSSGGSRRHHAELAEADDMIRFCLRHGNDLLALDALCDRLGFAISTGLSSGVMSAAARLLLRQDEFIVVHGNRSCRRRVFLFEHLLLFSKPRLLETAGLEKYTFKQSLKMCNIGLTETVGSAGTQFEVWLHKRKKGGSRWVLQAPSADIKDCWVKDISRLLWSQAKQKRDQQALLSPLKCVLLVDMASGKHGSETEKACNGSVVGTSVATGASSGGLNSSPGLADRPTVGGVCMAAAGAAAEAAAECKGSLHQQAATISGMGGNATKASMILSAASSTASAASSLLGESSPRDEGSSSQLLSASSSVASFHTDLSEAGRLGCGGGGSSNGSCVGSSSSSSNSTETLSPAQEIAQRVGLQLETAPPESAPAPVAPPRGNGRVGQGARLLVSPSTND